MSDLHRDIKQLIIDALGLEDISTHDIGNDHRAEQAREGAVPAAIGGIADDQREQDEAGEEAAGTAEEVERAGDGRRG